MTDSMTEYLSYIERLVGASERHFGNATDIWNSFGVGSPQLQSDAANAALIEYQKAASRLRRTPGLLAAFVRWTGWVTSETVRSRALDPPAAACVPCS